MTNSLRSIRLLLVDDNPMMITALKLLLRQETAAYVCGDAQNGREALEKLEYLDVDIVITDINMPELDGIALTAQIKTRFPLVQVIALTMYSDPVYVKEIMEAGASGFVLKNTSRNELLKAINLVAANSTYFDSEITGSVLDSVLDTRKSATKGFEETRIVSLTERERSILQLSAEGCSLAEIGEKLFLQVPTLEMYLKNIFRKTNTKTTKELVNYGLANRLVSTSAAS